MKQVEQPPVLQSSNMFAACEEILRRSFFLSSRAFLRQFLCVSPRGFAISALKSSLVLGCWCLVLLPTGCAVGPNYKTPRTAVAASFANSLTNAMHADETTL